MSETKKMKGWTFWAWRPRPDPDRIDLDVAGLIELLEQHGLHVYASGPEDLIDVPLSKAHDESIRAEMHLRELAKQAQEQPQVGDDHSCTEPERKLLDAAKMFGRAQAAVRVLQDGAPKNDPRWQVFDGARVELYSAIEQVLEAEEKVSQLTPEEVYKQRAEVAEKRVAELEESYGRLQGTSSAAHWRLGEMNKEEAKYRAQIRTLESTVLVHQEKAQQAERELLNKSGELELAEGHIKSLEMRLKASNERIEERDMKLARVLSKLDNYTWPKERIELVNELCGIIRD